MDLNRRQFVLLTISATAAVCCNALTQASETTAPATQPSTQPALPPGAVDAGSLDTFKSDDVYDDFREQGFFVIRRDEKIFALSSVCTHKGCKVRVQNDLSFKCKCHGSTFDRDGHVTKGPAHRDLPRVAVALDANSHVLVDPDQKMPAPRRPS